MKKGADGVVARWFFFDFFYFFMRDPGKTKGGGTRSAPPIASCA